MSYQIIFENRICVEGGLQPSEVQRALKYWRSEGMKGVYEAKEEPRLPKTEIRLANPHK